MLSHERKKINDRVSWLRHGAFHRVGGPAIIWTTKDYHWRQYGLLHRVDGPAVILFSGERMYFKRGVSVR